MSHENRNVGRSADGTLHLSEYHLRGEVVEAQLPMYHGTVSGLPDGVDALIVTSDLQGVVPATERSKDANFGGATASNEETYNSVKTNAEVDSNPMQSTSEDQLLGEVLPAYVRLLLEVEWPELDPERIGVLMCGDLYALRGKRGASGNPVPVWLAFRAAFGWVAGVHGNHDLTDEADAHRLHSVEGIHAMDGPDAMINAGPQRVALRQVPPNPASCASRAWAASSAGRTSRAAAGRAVPAIRTQAAEAAAGLLAFASKPGHRRAWA